MLFVACVGCAVGGRNRAISGLSNDLLLSLLFYFILFLKFLLFCVAQLSLCSLVLSLLHNADLPFAQARLGNHQCTELNATRF
jgi:hypothetical protein